MFFIAGEGRPGGRIPTVFGPFATETDAESWMQKLPPGDYMVCGPAAICEKFTVAAPVVTKNV